MSEYTSYSYESEPEITTSLLATAAGIVLTGTMLTARASVAAVAVLARRHAERVRAYEETGISPLQARRAALAEQPLLAAAVAAEFGCCPTLESDCALPPFEAAFSRGVERLHAAEARVLADSLGAVLAERGYRLQPQRTARPGTVLVRGRREDETSVVASVQPKRGVLEIDLAGFRDGACAQERQALEQALRRRGIRLSVRVRQRHGCEAGGALARAADRSCATRGSTGGRRMAVQGTRKR